MNIAQKITTSAATVALLTTLATQAAFAATVTIQNNGRGSFNSANLNQNTNKTVTQTQMSFVANGVSNDVNTGRNRANGNLGPSMALSGSSSVNNGITVNGNGNVSTLTSCSTSTGTNGVTISGNLGNSFNTANLNANNNTTVTQSQSSMVINGINNDVNTGGNRASNNLGGGTVISGDSTVNNGITVNGSSNNSSC